VTLGPSAPSSHDLVGRVLGSRYRLTAAIGGGASAAVFSAEDVVLRRQVAVKILHPALAADEAFIDRFQNEAQIAAALRHPNVLLVHDWGDDGGSPFLVTELLEGGSLKSLLDQGFRASPSQALQLGLEACRGLDHAHRRGLVHRDIKPANLLFDEDGRLRVADFGLARAIAEAAATEPLGAVLGTARYASPEQVEGRPLDGRSDVYSLALVLVEAITGEVPFAAETSAATLLARLERPLQPPGAVGPLAEALAAAGRTDREGRSDAATFGRMLKAAATKLDRPAPLPLTGLVLGAAAAGPGPATAHPDPRPYDAEADRDGGVGSDGGDGGVGSDGGDGGDGETTASIPIVGREPPVAQQGRPEGAAAAAPPEPVDLEAPAPPKRKRRRLVVLLLLALVLAAAAAAAAIYQPWRPTVDVPQIVGLGREEAAARLRAEDLGLKVSGRVPSETVDAGRVVATRPARQRQGRSVSVTLSSGPEERMLPAVAGRPAEEVARSLTGLGLEVSQTPIDSTDVPIGTTISIEPPAGSRVPRGATVTLTVSAGPPARPVPEVAGKSIDEALAALEAAGLKGTKVEMFDDKVAAGKVIGTNPAPGTAIRPGLAVAINVSKGPDLVTVPNVSGRSPAAAQQALNSAGLVVSTTYGPPNGQVFSTDPAAGAKVKRASTVALYTR
jgi:beta-lactam-binding protein with PASTA domain/serine/threonine protein kinase